MALKKMHSVFDMWTDDQCVADLLLDDASQADVAELAAGRWKVLGVRASADARTNES